MTSPSLYQVISAAGLAPEALQVRLCGVWALRRTTGPPSTTGSEGGTVMQKQTYSSKQKDSLQLRASAEPQRRITDIELAVALSPSSIYNNTFLLPSVYLTRCSFRQEKRPRAVVIWWKKKKKHTHTQTYLFPFLGLALLLYLLLLLQSDVSTELLICSFICMVSHAPLSSQACHPWWRRLSPQPIREGVNMGFVLAFLAPSTEPISLCVSELSEVLPLPRHGH